MNQSDNTSVPSRPVKATPEQLREAIIEKLQNYYDDSDEEKADQILALFATFLASIELPEKHDLSGLKLEELQTLAGRYIKGSNAAIDQSQAIIDKLIKELRNG